MLAHPLLLFHFLAFLYVMLALKNISKSPKSRLLNIRCATLFLYLSPFVFPTFQFMCFPHLPHFTSTSSSCFRLPCLLLSLNTSLLPSVTPASLSTFFCN